MSYRNKPGRYAKVLKRYGSKAFGVPHKAPKVGSYPLEPVQRARYAIALTKAPNFKGGRTLAKQIRRRAVALHPPLKNFGR